MNFCLATVGRPSFASNDSGKSCALEKRDERIRSRSMGGHCHFFVHAAKKDNGDARRLPNFKLMPWGLPGSFFRYKFALHCPVQIVNAELIDFSTSVRTTVPAFQ